MPSKEAARKSRKKENNRAYYEAHRESILSERKDKYSSECRSQRHANEYYKNVTASREKSAEATKTSFNKDLAKSRIESAERQREYYHQDLEKSRVDSAESTKEHYRKDVAKSRAATRSSTSKYYFSNIEKLCKESKHREDPIKWNGSILYFRGAKILEVVMDAILAAGGDKIEHVILTGCSAGGLATYLHADYVRSKVSSHIPVHAIADAGYFLDAPNVNGEMYIRGLFQYVFNMQKCKNAVNQDCITANPTEEWKCFMAQYTYPHIKTPIFLLNARYDTYQIGNILGLNCYPPNCTADQMKEFENYGNEFLNAAAPAISSTSNGVYIDSCQIHCQSLTPTPWSKFIVGGQTMRDTFNAWLTNSTATKSKVVDCTYPCNPTCS